MEPLDRLKQLFGLPPSSRDFAVMVKIAELKARVETQEEYISDLEDQIAGMHGAIMEDRQRRANAEQDLEHKGRPDIVVDYPSEKWLST
jgi:hypothetical protein